LSPLMCLLILVNNYQTFSFQILSILSRNTSNKCRFGPLYVAGKIAQSAFQPWKELV